MTTMTETPTCPECEAPLSGDTDHCDQCGAGYCACTTKPGDPLYPCNHHNPR